MKKTELTFGIISLISLIINSFGIVGSQFLLVVVLIFFAVYYLFFGFALLNDISWKGIFEKDSYKELSFVSIIGGILSGIILCPAVLAILFCLLSWYGAGLLILESLLGLASFVVLSVFFFFTWKKNWDFYQNIFCRILIFGFILLFLAWKTRFIS